MKMFNQNIIYRLVIFSTFAILFFIAIACEKTIEIDLEDAKIRIVVNSELNPDSTIVVNVTRSRHILDNADISTLADADVKLYEDDVLIGTMIYDVGGNYRIDYKPILGKTYKVTVSHSSYDPVYASSSIPKSVVFSAIDTTKSYDEYGSVYTNFNIKFKDPANEPNYYMVSLRNRYIYEYEDPEMITHDTVVSGDTIIVIVNHGGIRREENIDRIWFNSEDMIVEANIYQRNAVVFSDELIDGNEYSLKLSVDQYSFYSDTNMILVDFYAISPEFYNYMISFEKHQNASGDPFAEPVMVFSNIFDGIGIFAASHVYTDSIQVIGSFGGGFYYE